MEKPTIDEPSHKNPPFIDEDTHENPPSIKEHSQENPPQFPFLEQFLQIPPTIVDDSQENPPQFPFLDQFLQIPPAIAEDSQENPPQFPFLEQFLRMPPAMVDDSLENPPPFPFSEQFLENPPVIDEDLSENLITIPEISQENPLTDITSEVLPENPHVFSEISLENPPVMDEASSETLIAIDEHSHENPNTDILCDVSQQNPSTDILSNVSQENPSTDIVGPSSQENPSNNDKNGFRFELKPALRLKLAIESLCDPEYNPPGLGRIDVDEKGFGITVGNPSDVHGHLWLMGSKLGNFQCSNPMVGKLVDLRIISETLVVDEKDTVVVSHIDGSNEISFSFGEEPTRAFTVELLENTVEIQEFPYVTIFCEAAIPSHDVDLLIEQLFLNERPQIVSVDIMAKKATIFVGKDKILSLSYDYEDMGFDGTRGMGGRGQRHHAWFYWTYPEMLKKAARLFYAFLVSFASTPANTVMLRFTLQELGNLMFLMEAFKMIPNLDTHLHELQNRPSSLENPSPFSKTSLKSKLAFSETSVENPAAIAETSLRNPPALSESSLENPTALSESNLKNPTAFSDTSLENSPAVSETSVENPPTFSETSLENPPAMDEAPSETSIAMDELSKASPIIITEHSLVNPSTDIPSEVSQENPSTVIISEVPQQNPPFDIAGPSQQTPSTVTISEFSKEIPSTNIAEPSQGNPSTDIAEPSQENPSNNDNNGFRFKLKPAQRLKVAIEALCDPEFNPPGTGRIDVDVKGFGITVGKPSDVHGHLWLLASRLGSFQCSIPMAGKLVDLREISENLVADEKDTVTVSHIDGSNEISFSFGEEPTRGFIVELLENAAEIPEFPCVTIFCEAAIPSHDVDLLIEQLFQNERPQTVSVDIMAKKATIFVGNDKLLSLNYDYEDMGFDGTRGMGVGGQRHHAWFYWTYPEVLKKAARLFYAFLVSFASTPPNTVMLRFTLQELGDLMFLKEAFEMIPNLDAHLHELKNKRSSSLEK